MYSLTLPNLVFTFYICSESIINDKVKEKCICLNLLQWAPITLIDVSTPNSVRVE